MSSTLAFLSAPPPDYGSRLSRLRWRRRVPADRDVELSRSEAAREAFAEGSIWVVVRDAAALPVGAPRLPSPAARRILLVGTCLRTDAAALHTLRELESATVRPGPQAQDASACAALAFRPKEFPPNADESVDAFLWRLLTLREEPMWDADWLALPFEDSSLWGRPELTARIPAGAQRLLDVGCGSGGLSAAIEKARPGTRTTGIEKNPQAAGRARAILDRVFDGDAAEVLEALAREGEEFDTFLFADVLEHLSDPIGALARARRVASGDALLVASVPNVGHLSVVRDLVRGRFDPVPAGLTDVGHLRWFTRTFLAEALEEAGWRVVAIESFPGAPPPEAGEFLSFLSGWEGLDRESLATYQWIAVASAR